MLMAAAEAANARCRCHQSAAPADPAQSSLHSSCLSTAEQGKEGLTMKGCTN